MHLYLTIWTYFVIGTIGVEEVAEDTLLLVHAVIRHGARSPDHRASFPTDVYKNFSYYPYGIGELNEEGIKKSFWLGKKLRRRYDTFLGPKYYPEMLEATSSGASRCRMTMRLVLAGMFPPRPSETFQEGLPWQPIAFKYTNDKTDLMIVSDRYVRCIHTLALQEEFNRCKDRNYINRYLTEHTGLIIDSVHKVFYIEDTINAQQENGLPLPSWAIPIWPEPLQTCANDYWRHIAKNKTVLGYIGVIFLNKILDDTMEKIKENSTLDQRKLFLYTVHEHNICMFLGVLDNYNDFVMNYLANIMFEVHKINGVYGFKVYFDNRDGNGLKLLEIPECGTFCPVDRFRELMAFYINSEPCPL